MNPFDQRTIRWGILLFSFLVVTTGGCGVKGPPVPPARVLPPRISDLSYSLQNKAVMLKWSLPRDEKMVESGVQGYIVMRAKSLLSLQNCKNCPLKFEPVKAVEIQDGNRGAGDSVLLTYREEIQGGYRYVYKVVGYAGGGVLGRESNQVDFNFEP